MEENRNIGPYVRELHLYIKNMINEEISKQVKGMTFIKSIVLNILKCAENNKIQLCQKDLEDKLSVSKSTMSELLNSMERLNIISRVPFNKDNRKKYIILTDEGRIIQRKVSSIINHCEVEIKNRISKEELKVFFNLIEKLQKKGE